MKGESSIKDGLSELGIHNEEMKEWNGLRHKAGDVLGPQAVVCDDARVVPHRIAVHFLFLREGL